MIRYTTERLGEGSWEVREVTPGHPELLVATFHEDIRSKPVKGKYGPELAMIDAAQMRAGIFATVMEQLIARGEIELGE
jgi:hypothetical protein